MRNITVLCVALAIFNSVYAFKNKSELTKSTFIQVNPMSNFIKQEKEDLIDLTHTNIFDVIELVRTPIIVSSRNSFIIRPSSQPNGFIIRPSSQPDGFVIRPSSQPNGFVIRPSSTPSSLQKADTIYIKVNETESVERYDLNYYCQEALIEKNSRCEEKGQWAYDLDAMGFDGALNINFCCEKQGSTQLRIYDRGLNNFHQYYTSNELAHNYFNSIGQRSLNDAFGEEDEYSECTGEVSSLDLTDHYTLGVRDVNGDMCHYPCADESGNLNAGASTSGSLCVLDEVSNRTSNECKNVLHRLQECNELNPNQEKACTESVDQFAGTGEVDRCLLEYRQAYDVAISLCIPNFDNICL